MKHIVVIGAGPAGYPAALKAAQLGAQVTLIEKNKLGGVCLHCGCIPSKSFLDASHRFQTVFSTVSLGGESATDAAEKLFAQCDFQKIKARQKAATQKLSQGISFLLKKANVTVLEGEASFVDEHTLTVRSSQGEQMISFDGVIIATGSQAFYPPPFEVLRGEIYDNTNFFDMPSLPKSLAIIGGGVIGCEMADAMCGLGVNVHVVEMQPRLLPQEAEGVSRLLTQSFVKRGIHIHAGASAQAVQKTEGGFEIVLSTGEKLQAENILVAIGRQIDLQGLGLERLGLSWDRKGLKVNPQTLQVKDHIFAAGDVTGLCPLAHAATRQGVVAAGNLCGAEMQYHNEQVPRVIYTQPEIASVGLSQTQAQAQGIDVKVQKSFFLSNGRAVAQGQTEGYAEWLSESASGKLLGATVAGPGASELIHVATVSLTAGLTVKQLQEVIFAHPTFSEVWGEALAR